MDSFFYLYVNGKEVGYSQISHATSEFDVTEFLQDGENVIDVVVLKWCASSYLECQDKFRFSGIFRSVYMLCRPKEHIVDYRFDASTLNGIGTLSFFNESDVDMCLEFDGKTLFVEKRQQIVTEVYSVNAWSAEHPTLYKLVIRACGEMIIENVGFRNISIDKSVFKINNESVKLKGVNRHEFSAVGGATVTLEETYKDLQLMKDLNVNAIRTSHYPDIPEFYLLCDVMGFYVIDEADLETHGGATHQNGYDLKIWNEFVENGTFSEGIYMREQALVERDKNRACVIMWSLGNESNFGKDFVKGAKYIQNRDSRPIHYEGLQNAPKKYYYSKYVNVVSSMYPSIDWIKKNVIKKRREKRPFVLCEYSHAMGNSNGDLKDYWKLIYNEPQCMGAFVWEWADHAIYQENGWKYGGDFGEKYHDDNFCCDGLLTPDRKLKSGALEMKAVYGGKLSSDKKSVSIPKPEQKNMPVEIDVDTDTAIIKQLKVNGKEILLSPMKLNMLRYIDNERLNQAEYNEFGMKDLKSYVKEYKKTKNGYVFEGVMISDCLSPALFYTLTYEVISGGLKITLSYKLNNYVKRIPRIGFEFAISNEYSTFDYVGYGPTESYVDKHIATEYGIYTSTAEENFTNYIRPQENGSHYGTDYLHVRKLMSVTADKDFSFSILPYRTTHGHETFLRT